jgi:serine/threonine protein kinase
MPASPGTRFGPYEIVKPIGAGGMGEVYEARDTRLDRPVAIKVLPPELAADAAARARFDREARAIAALNHPNICALHDIGDADGHGFLVMERLEGETLQERLQRGPLDIEQTIDYGIALADALDAAHGRSLIHRDLKPANVFITTRGVVKILDFGLAKSVLEADADVTHSVNASLTSTGTTLGTVAYMSPEQLRGEPLDVRTDLFSFGLVLYEMATGERAFGGATVVVAAAGILSQQPPAPRGLRAEVPEGLERSILKALEKDRALRYQSAGEMRAHLLDVKRGVLPAFAPTVPVSSGAAQSLSQPGRSRFRSVVFALCLTAIAIALVDWLQGDRPPSSPQTEVAPAAPPISPPPVPAAEALSQQPAPPQTPEPAPKPDATKPSATLNRPAATNKPDVPTDADIISRVPSATPPTLDPGPLPSALPGNPPFAGRARPGRGLGAGGLGAATLLKALSGAPKETFDLVYASNDPEARTMALQIRTVLTTAGWTNASTTELAAPQVKIGIFAPNVTRGVTALTQWAVRQGLQPDYRHVASLPRLRIVIGKQEPLRPEASPQ